MAVWVDNGSTSLTIQDAIDSLPTAGGKVWIGPGTYNITEDIEIKDRDNVEIQGSGFATKIFVNTTTGDREAGIDAIRVENANNIRISDLQIDGNRDNNTWDGATSSAISGLMFSAQENGKSAIVLRNCNNVMIQNCWLRECRSCGIRCWGNNSYMSFLNNWVENCVRSIYTWEYPSPEVSHVYSIGNIIWNGGYGIYYSSGTDNGVISGNVVYNISDQDLISGFGIYLDTIGNNTTIVGNTISGNAVTKRGITASSNPVYGNGENVTISGNTVYNLRQQNNDFGIAVDESYGVTITGNTVDTTGDSGIIVADGQDAVVSGNIIRNAGADPQGFGIEITNIDGVQVTGNYIDTTFQQGIIEYNSSSNIQIADNIVKNAGSGDADGVYVTDPNVNVSGNLCTGCRNGIRLFDIGDDAMCRVVNNDCNLNEWSGINIKGAGKNVINSNVCANNDQGAVGGSGISLESQDTNHSTRNIVTGNQLIDTQDTPTQQRGYAEDDANQDYNNVSHNHALGNVSAQITINGANDVNQDNITA